MGSKPRWRGRLADCKFGPKARPPRPKVRSESAARTTIGPPTTLWDGPSYHIIHFQLSSYALRGKVDFHFGASDDSRDKTGHETRDRDARAHGTCMWRGGAPGRVFPDPLDELMRRRRRKRAHIDRSTATVPAHAHPQISLAGAFLRRFFTAAGGVCHSLVPRPWYRWFILNKLLSQKKEEKQAAS